MRDGSSNNYVLNLDTCASGVKGLETSTPSPTTTFGPMSSIAHSFSPTCMSPPTVSYINFDRAQSQSQSAPSPAALNISLPLHPYRRYHSRTSPIKTRQEPFDDLEIHPVRPAIIRLEPPSASALARRRSSPLMGFTSVANSNLPECESSLSKPHLRDDESPRSPHPFQTQPPNLSDDQSTSQTQPETRISTECCSPATVATTADDNDETHRVQFADTSNSTAGAVC